MPRHRGYKQPVYAERSREHIAALEALYQAWCLARDGDPALAQRFVWLWSMRLQPNAILAELERLSACGHTSTPS